MSYFSAIDSFFHHSDREIVEEFTRRRRDPRDDAMASSGSWFYQPHEADCSLDVYEQITCSVGAQPDDYAD